MEKNTTSKEEMTHKEERKGLICAAISISVILLGCTFGFYYLGILTHKLLEITYGLSPMAFVNVIDKAVTMWIIGVVTIPAAFLIFTTALILIGIGLSPLLIIFGARLESADGDVDPVDLSAVSTCYLSKPSDK